MDAPVSGLKRPSHSPVREWSVRILLILLLGGGLGLGVHVALQFSRGHNPFQDLWVSMVDGRPFPLASLFQPSSGSTSLSLVVPQPDYPSAVEPTVIPTPPEMTALPSPPPEPAPLPAAEPKTPEPTAPEPTASPSTPSVPQDTPPPPAEPAPLQSAPTAAPPPMPEPNITPPQAMLPPLIVSTTPTPRDSKQVPNLATLGDFRNLGRTVPPLTTAPQPEMTATNAAGLTLPVVARDGRAAWQTYAAPPVNPLPPIRLALIFNDLGLEQDVSAAIADKFPPDVAMAFTPYGGVLDRQIKQAREQGHEVFLSLPVEQVGYPARDPGPFGLLVAARDDENLARMEQSLARMQGYIGVIAEDGPFLRSPQMIPILKALEEHGLSYVSTDLADAPVSLPRLQVTDNLFPGQFRESLQERLDYALKRAQTEHQAVVVVPATPLSLHVVGEWLKTLSKQNVVLVPPSALFRRSMPQVDANP